MKLTITINMDNAAFDEPGPELSRILRDLANRYHDTACDDYHSITDINGNTVGEAVIEE